MIPNSFMSPSGKESITEAERDKLMWFNTKRFWHCYYNPKTKVLYSQFGCVVMDDAYDYLVGLGLMNENSEMINWCEKD